MTRVFVLFGSNIEPERNFARAMDLLRERFEVAATSPAYRTAPVGDEEQDDFINAAVELRTAEDPEAIQAALRGIEDRLGRRRDPSRPLGPRNVDLDLVFIEGRAGVFGKLELPSPALARDAFAIVPVAALAPDLVHPQLGTTLGELSRRARAATSRPPVEVLEDRPMSGGGRVAIVTGGAVRLGRAIVEELARAGFSVVFTYRTSAREAHDLARALSAAGTETLAVRVDLDDPVVRAGLVGSVVDRFGRLDVLVNNAAVFPRTPLDTIDAGALDAVLRTNLTAPVLLTLDAAPALRERAGCVVNIADIYGLFPLKGHLAYSVSKAALMAATKALAVELAPEVRVNAVAPGIALFPPDYDDETKQRLLRRTLLQRPGNAAEIASAVRYLVDGTHTMTGQVLVLDGGRTIAL